MAMEHDNEKVPPRIVRYQKMGINIKENMVTFGNVIPRSQTFDLTTLDTRAALHTFLCDTHTDSEIVDLTIGLMDLVRLQQAKIKKLETR